MSKTLNRVCICGHFGSGKNLLNGQTVKTKIVTEELERRLGEREVLKLDTHGGKKKIFSLPLLLYRVLKKCKNIVVLPAQNGLRIIAPLLILENKFFHRKLHYVVIGGWLPGFLEKRKGLAEILKKFDCIYVETSTMKRALDAKGFKNVEIMPNCKKLNILDKSKLVYTSDEPYKLCTFSRVMKEKGIRNAVDAVCYVNEQYGRPVYTLDIYGEIDAAQTKWFEELKVSFPDYVKYGGFVSFDRSVEVIQNYFALLFPTEFYTEGIPGTIIDAYAAGVPVISSKWESFEDMIDDGVSGIGYDFYNPEHLKSLLSEIAENPGTISNMKVACINKAEKFTPETAVDILINKL